MVDVVKALVNFSAVDEVSEGCLEWEWKRCADSVV
jgi:hypothetical protein